MLKFLMIIFKEKKNFWEIYPKIVYIENKNVIFTNKKKKKKKKKFFFF